MQKSEYNMYVHFNLKYFKNLKSYGNEWQWWLHNNVNVFNSTELYN